MRVFAFVLTLMMQQQLTILTQHAISVLKLYVHNIIMDVFYKF